MKRAYVLIYSVSTGGREKIREWANAESMVSVWRFDMPHSFYLISENSAEELAQSLRKFTGPKGRFLIAELGANRQGWLPAETWYLLQNKSLKKKQKE